MVGEAGCGVIGVKGNGEGSQGAMATMQFTCQEQAWA
jgi:hypothetical protein